MCCTYPLQLHALHAFLFHCRSKAQKDKILNIYNNIVSHINGLSDFIDIICLSGNKDLKSVCKIVGLVFIFFVSDLHLLTSHSQMQMHVQHG